MKQPADLPATAGDAIQAAVAASVERLLAREAAVLLGRNVEALHQARVAVRRLRSDLRTFRSLVDARWCTSLRQELRWLGSELGAVRDVDVFTARVRANLGTPSASAIALRAAARAQRVSARQSLVFAMQSNRYKSLRDTMIAAAHDPKVSAEARSGGTRSILRCVAATWHRLQAAVLDSPRRPTAAVLHAIRINAKRARYAAEAAAVIAGKRACRFADAAALIQDVLGEYHDAQESMRRLRRLRLAPGARRAAEALLRSERQAASRALREWPSAWQSFDKKRLRSWF